VEEVSSTDGKQNRSGGGSEERTVAEEVEVDSFQVSAGDDYVSSSGE